MRNIDSMIRGDVLASKQAQLSTMHSKDFHDKGRASKGSTSTQQIWQTTIDKCIVI